MRRDVLKGESFIGRKAQLERLFKIFKIDEGSVFNPAVIIVHGEPGVGKTTLLKKFARYCRQIDLVWAGCQAEGVQTDPWIVILNRLLNLRGVDPEQYNIYRSLIERFLPQGSQPREDPLASQDTGAWERLSGLLSRWADLKPLIILIEDIHNAGSHTLNCLRTVARNIILGDARKGLGIIVTVCTQQGSPASAWITELSKHPSVHLIELKEFNQQEVARYVRALLTKGVEEELLQQIWRLTGGNPFFINILVADLLHGGKIYYKEGLWRKRKDLPWQVPAQLKDLLQKRFLSLDPQLRGILSVIAVANKPLSILVIAKVLNKSQDHINSGVSWLVTHGFLEGLKPATWGLKHGLLRDVIYEGLPQHTRFSLHTRLAKALIEIHGPRDHRQMEEIATHAILGRDTLMIKGYAPLAARYAAERFAWERALFYHQAYLANLGQDQKSKRFETELALARIYLRLGRLEEGLKSCADILQKGVHLDPSLRLRTALTKVRILIAQGKVDVARQYIESVKSSIQWQDYREGLDLVLQECMIAHGLGDYRSLESLALAGISGSKRWGNYLSVEFINSLGVALYSTGRIDQAKGVLRESLQVDQADTRLGPIYANLGFFELVSGDLEHAVEDIGRGIQILEHIGDKQGLMASYVLLAEFHIMRAEYQKALQHIEYVRRWAQLTDNPKLEIIASRRLGDIYCQLGERLMAKRIFEGVISGFTRLGSFSSDKYEYMIKLGGLNAQDQNPDLAFSLFEEANLQIAGKSIEPDILLASDIEMAEAALISQKQDIAEGIINRIQTRDPMHLDLYKPQKVRWLIIKGILARQKGDYQDAVTNLEGSIALSSQMGIPLHLAKGLYELGKVYQLMQRLPEAQDAFHKGLKILVDILGNVPPDLRQTFRASSLFTQTQQSLLELQTAMTPEPRLAPIDQELLLTTRMEGILQGVLEARDVHSCQYLILEGALSLSGATRAALLLRQEMSPQGVPLLCIDVDNHPVEFVVASWIEMGPERLRSIPQGQIIEGLKGPLSILQDRFLYLRLTATDRLIGQLILEIGTRPSDPILGVLRSFIARASIILDRLHMIQGLKEQHERAQREAQVSLEQLRLKHTQFEARMIPLGIIGTSEPMQRVYELVERVSSLEIPVLLEGETGTGKELFARAIHFLSGRRFRPFCAINCAAITETLLDSELFGYMKGAFTGATRDHPGLFESAHQGTLFLDEIEEMSQGMQKKLLRTIEDGQIRRVGGTHSIHVDVRIIGATNKSLREAVKMGKFREDLFHRLNIVVINLPPLRERKTDIPLLVAHFLDKIRKERGIKIDVEPSALRRLTSYHWPGNIRELENMILRFAVWGKKLIQASDIEFEQEGDMIGLGSMHGRTLREITDLIIERVLKEEGWDIPSAAKRLGLAQSTLYYRLKRMGIKDKKDRKFQDL